MVIDDLSKAFASKDFLAEDGIIFISIDDNEIHNLRILMDEIFGSQHFVAQLKEGYQEKNTFYQNVCRTCLIILLIYSKMQNFPFK